MQNYDIKNELAQNLGANETLVWTGKPKGGVIFRSSDAFLIPFSLLWGGFAVFWELGVIASGAPFFFKLWGIPFLIVGFYMAIGRFYIDSKRRANTIYGITKDRIIIKSGVFNSDIKSVNIKTLSDITLNQKADNSGTIMLGSTNLRYSMMQGMNWPGVQQAPQLEFIEDVKTVYDKLIELQRQN